MASLTQKIKKALYPVIMFFSKSTGKGKVLHNSENAKPDTSFYGLQATLNNGERYSFEQLKGKKILIVNTASDCGFTGQYAELQKLYKQFENKLTVIGFPANDFMQQEKSNDDTIAQFCQINYGVSFPLVKKSVVLKQSGQHDVFYWLSHRNQNGWNDQQPDWNFSKYLINESGVLTDYFGPAISPLDTAVINAVNK